LPDLRGRVPSPRHSAKQQEGEGYALSAVYGADAPHVEDEISASAGMEHIRGGPIYESHGLRRAHIPHLFPVRGGLSLWRWRGRLISTEQRAIGLPKAWPARMLRMFINLCLGPNKPNRLQAAVERLGIVSSISHLDGLISTSMNGGDSYYKYLP
jgi:hypothetical protein